MPTVIFAMPFEGPARDFLDEVLAELAVTVGGRDFDRQLVAGVLAFELALESRHQVAVPVKIGKRLAPGGAVDDRTGIILQGVVEQDDRVFLDAQGGGSM